MSDMTDKLPRRNATISFLRPRVSGSPGPEAVAVHGPFDLESSPERTQMDGVDDIFGDDLSSNAT